MKRKILTGILVASFVLAAGSSLVYAQKDTTAECKPGQSLSEALGLTGQEIRDEIQSGVTLEELFASRGLDYATFLAEMVADQFSCVDQALADGKITEPQAERLKAAIESHSENGTLFFWGRKSRHDQKPPMPILEELATVFGMDAVDLKNDLDEGKSLAEIADQQGLDIDVLYVDWVALRIADMEAAVANGSVSEDRAQQAIDQLHEKLSQGENFGEWTLPQHETFSRHEKLIFFAGKDLAQKIFAAIEMTPAEIRESLANGQTIQELVSEKGVDADTLYHDWLNEQIALINQKLSDGKLTQAQADEMLNRLEAQLAQPFPWDLLGAVRQNRIEKLGRGGHGMPENPGQDVSDF